MDTNDSYSPSQLFRIEAGNSNVFLAFISLFLEFILEKLFWGLRRGSGDLTSPFVLFMPWCDFVQEIKLIL